MPLAMVSELPDGGATEVAHPQEPLQSLILLRDGARVRAYVNVCPHAGRALSWAPGQFLITPQGRLVCAAHGAAFDPESGVCVSGPCLGASLTAVPIDIRAGEVYLVGETHAP